MTGGQLAARTSQRDAGRVGRIGETSDARAFYRHVETLAGGAIVWTDDNLMVLRPEDQVERNGIVELMPASGSVGGWGAVLVRGQRGTSGRTHVHAGESEAFFILEGDIELWGASSTTPLVPGTFVLIPPDTEHGLRVLSEEARWLAIWPAALDGLLDALAAARAEGRDDAETVAELRRRHGVSAGGPIPAVE